MYHKCVFQVDSCVGRQEHLSANLFHFVKENTTINIKLSSTSHLSQSCLNESTANVDLPSGLEALVAAVAPSFAGYGTEVADSLGVSCLGLGCSHRLHRNEPTSTGNGGASDLLRPPKGLILFGPPGSGKSSLMRGLVAALGCNSVELPHSVLLSRCVLVTCIFSSFQSSRNVTACERADSKATRRGLSRGSSRKLRPKPPAAC